MSESNKVQKIEIGIKNSSKEFYVISSQVVKKEDFDKFAEDLVKSLNGKGNGASIVDKDGDFLYISPESVGYMQILNIN
ncbi:hypothetical protein [Staphylococcus chromogenes]|uniref:hypothetical protein n=1 Tax=Staphylococcus chromogenes TaxID=46126 RepID=UPI002887707A|nr:hypothetical protein [Staphylococcus chromogenes]MDT0656381.1 hypothetical protein [Staphylococcus chromogenes]MDT0672736.1 hypothetical protein [Staphylococcus chromogenes]MDT0674955.1 hypothetical protein [Staphylococcus chromogenes]MDT0699157.1 hypothetical protein [Staphylococcus chromogenes]